MSVLTPKTNGFVNLSYCVNQVLADLEDYSGRRVEKCTQLAIRAYMDANIFSSVAVEVVYLPMNSSGIVDISTLTDYVDYSKIALLVNGKYWILNCNEKIGLVREELDESEAALIFNTGAPSFPVEDGYVFSDHYMNGTFRSGLLGMGGGFSRSFFRVDLEKMQIQFDTSVPRNQIILEYISTGIKATGATMIPRSAVEYIIAYIHWQLIQFNPLIDRFTKREAKEEFLEREHMMREFDLRFNKEEYFQSLYVNYKQTPKM